MNAVINNLHWQSDWCGDEVGYDDVEIVGLYTAHHLGVDIYLNAETGIVLEIIPHDKEE